MATDPDEGRIETPIDAEVAGARLDAFLAAKYAEFSRVQWRKAINAGRVQVNGERAKAAYRLSAGEIVTLELPERVADRPQPEAIPLDILYEDDALVAINKPAGMVVHPAKGHWNGTLAAALVHHFDQLSSTGGLTRPGIVHRLDRETSGVLVVAKNDRVHLALSRQFEARTTEKEYLALTHGVPDRDRDMICQPIGAHPYQREKMAIRAGHSTSRDAETFYEVQERLAGFGVVKVMPKTGRTHQIRVHLAHIGCAVLCDRLYSGRSRISLGEIRDHVEDDNLVLERVALHACRLNIEHPDTGERIEFVAPLAADIVATLEALREHRSLRK